LTFTITARADAKPLASVSQTIQASSDCSALSIVLDGTQTSGDDMATGNTADLSTANDQMAADLAPPPDLGNCGSPPTLHPNPNVYCVGSGATATYCTAKTQQCCVPATGSSTCGAVGTSCPTTPVWVWQCLQTAHCANGFCCLTGTPMTNECGWDSIAGNGATPQGAFCRTSCAVNETYVCESDQDCAYVDARMKCYATKWGGLQFGYCSLTPP
jgi:hypothetical protein